MIHQGLWIWGTVEALLKCSHHVLGAQDINVGYRWYSPWSLKGCLSLFYTMNLHFFPFLNCIFSNTIYLFMPILLKYNFTSLRIASVKCTMRWFFPSKYRELRNRHPSPDFGCFHHPPKLPVGCQSLSISALGANVLLPVSVNLPFLDVSYEWKDTVCGLLHLLLSLSLVFLRFICCCCCC